MVLAVHYRFTTLNDLVSKEHVNVFSLLSYRLIIYSDYHQSTFKME